MKSVASSLKKASASREEKHFTSFPSENTFSHYPSAETIRSSGARTTLAFPSSH